MDTETSALDAMRADLVGVSLALGPNDACYIPLGHGGTDMFAEKPEQVPMKDAIAALKSGTLNEEQFIAGVIAATAGEAGKDNLEYWMGFAKARGMVIHFPLESSLKDNVYRTSQNADLRRRYLYGYLDPKPVFHRNKSTGRLYMERANATGGTDTDGNGQHVAAAA